RLAIKSGHARPETDQGHMPRPKSALIVFIQPTGHHFVPGCVRNVPNDRHWTIRELHEIAKPAESLQENEQSDARSGLASALFGKLQLEQVRGVHISKLA